MSNYIYGESLYHFGTKGMKWGVRRFQDEDGKLTDLGRQRYGKGGERSARGTARDLNKLDREITRSQAKADLYRTKAERKQSRREFKAIKRGEDIPEKTEKIKKLEERADQYQQLSDRGRKMTEKIINQALKSKKSIYSYDVRRSTNIGRNFIKSVAASAVLGNTTMFDSTAIGKTYRVKDDGQRRRAHRQYYDPNEKTSAVYWAY